VIGAYHPFFHEELERRVTTDRVERMTDLAGDICPDFAAYRYACGFLAGLNHALVLAEEIKKDIDAG
jgi:hypothetical protein